jgi:hypothetical protein
MARHQAITEPRAVLIVVTILQSRILVAGIVAFGAADLEELTGAVAGSCVAFHCNFDLLLERLCQHGSYLREELSGMAKGLGGWWVTYSWCAFSGDFALDGRCGVGWRT